MCSAMASHPWKIILPTDLGFRLHIFSSEAESVFAEFPDKSSNRPGSFPGWLINVSLVSRTLSGYQRRERREQRDQHPVPDYHTFPVCLPSMDSTE